MFSWGEHAAGVKEAIPLLRQGLGWNVVEAQCLPRVLRCMPIDERNVAKGSEVEERKPFKDKIREVMERKPEAL